MKKATLDTNLVIEEIADGQTIFGYVTLNTANTINIDRISGHIFFEARGKMAGHREKVLSFKVCSQKSIVKNDLNKIPFSIQMPDNYIDSYGGRNVNFSYKCEIIIEVNEKDIDKIDRDILSKVKLLITSDKTFKDSAYFLAIDQNSQYQVFEATSDFDLRPNFIISILVILLSGGLYACIMPAFNTWYIILGVILIALIVWAVTKFISEILSKVAIDIFEGEEATFNCAVTKSTKFKLTNNILHYSIIEKVTDNRGTSSTTHSVPIYTSEEKRLADFDNNNQLNFQYPEQKGLYTTEYMDAFLVWEMYLRGSTYFGIVLNFKCIFEVGKVTAYLEDSIEFGEQ